MIYAGHAIVGQDWKEPKVCSPFSRIYYIVDGEGILTVNGQRIVLKKGSVWLVPAGMTFVPFRISIRIFLQGSQPNSRTSPCRLPQFCAVTERGPAILNRI